MSSWVSPKELKKKYVVRGSYYDLIDGSQPYQCRDLLEISDIVHGVIAAGILRPQALFIMMNPGSSRPADSNYSIPRFRIGERTVQSIELVPAKPDPTQYQVMRVMSAMDWSYVRVINLSDLRQPDGSKFRVLVQQFESHFGSSIHSIFDAKREDGRLLAFDIESEGPVILAWSVDRLVISLAKKHCGCIPKERIVGWEKSNTPNAYYHPSRNRVQWFEEIMARLQRSFQG